MTRKTARLAVLVGLMCFGFTTVSSAQGGWKRWGAPARKYDPQAVETVTGEVVKVNKTPTGKRGAGAMSLTLKTSKETLEVLLGPVWFLEKQGLRLAPQDKVEIRGARTSYEGRTLLIAGEVRKGGKTLKLRDDAKVPWWAGRKWNF